jgi:hypothetical protein
MWLTIVSSYKLITRKENKHHNKLIIILIYLTKIKQLATTKLISNFKRLFVDRSYYIILPPSQNISKNQSKNLMYLVKNLE